MNRRLGKIINFCLITMFFVAACAAPEHANEPEEQTVEAAEAAQQTQEVQTLEKLNKVAVVIARDRYQSLEFNPVMEALQNAGYEIIVASDALGTAAGTQETTEVQASFEDLYTDELLTIVLIGGSNSLWDNEELHSLLLKMQSENKIIGAICYGTVTLAKAGVIGSGDVACWYNSTESDPEMKNAGVIDSNQNVTISGSIISGDGPSSAEEFAAEYVALLNS